MSNADKQISYDLQNDNVDFMFSKSPGRYEVLWRQKWNYVICFAIVLSLISIGIAVGGIVTNGKNISNTSKMLLNLQSNLEQASKKINVSQPKIIKQIVKQKGNQSNDLKTSIKQIKEQLTNTTVHLHQLEGSLQKLNQQYTSLLSRVPQAPSPGWFTPQNGYEYKLTSSKQNWQNSRTACQDIGGDLAVAGMHDYNVLKNIGVQLMRDNRVWIGLNDIANEGTWLWVDGTPSTRENTPWITSPQQPSNSGSGEDCAEILKNYNYRINDIPCSRINYGLCEKRMGRQA